MLFNSYHFLFAFLPLALFGYFFIAANVGQRAAIFFLVLMSLFFYGWWNPVYLLLLGVSISLNFGLGICLVGSSGVGLRKTLLAFGVVANLAILGYFKYANFFVDTINTVFGYSYALEKIVLPLAISFFTFQQITYIVDTYRGEVEEHSFLQYCLFVTFFPQLLAGPIVHHKEMLPQFRVESAMTFSYRNLAVGSALLVLGLFKKVVLADSMAAYAEPAFSIAEAGGTVYFLPGWVAATAFTLGVYFDFSAYSDMAVGLARMFGICLPINFLSPMKAKSMIELWQRWHITLTRFLRDYIFKPLGGAQHGQLRRHANTMITMLIGGLWHGASWTFVIWGGLNGLFLVINHVWVSVCKRVGVRPGGYRLWRVFSLFLTFHSFVAAAVFFKATNISAAMAMLKGMFGVNGFEFVKFLYSGLVNGGVEAFVFFYGKGICIIIAIYLIVLVMPNVYQIMGRGMEDFRFYPRRLYRYKGKLLKWDSSAAWALSMVVVFLVTLHVMAENVTEFIYFQF